MTTENMNDIEFLFNTVPYTTISNFQRENFHDRTGPSYSRYIIEVVNRIRKIESDFEQETRAFEKNCLNEEKQELLKFLNSQDPTALKTAIENWQLVEQDYWIDHLGKVAAIELITYGKPTVETMTKMVKLPEDAYIKATQICVRLANAIKEATIRAEQEIGVINEQQGIVQPNIEQTTTFDAGNQSPLKKLLLKKVK